MTAVRYFLSSVILCFLVAGCGGDSPTGPEPEPEPKPGKGVISGTVTTTDGSGGIKDALLELVDQGTISEEVYSKADGKFSFSSVESGQYEVKLTLPQGYRESGSTAETIQVKNNVSVEFEGEPIRNETITIKAGKQDTVATSSGAFLAVDASNASSDMEITISEIENGSKSVKIQIGPPGPSQSSVNMARNLKKTPSNSAESIQLNIAQKVKNSSADVLEFIVETAQGPLTLYADAEKEEITDTATNLASNFLTHPITFPTNTAIEFSSKPIEIDETCIDSFRELKEYSSDDTGNIPIILIHGIQLSKGRCDEFDDFDPLNLDDGDRSNTFDYLVEKLTSNINIDFDYKFYTYKYPSITPIKEASDGLWDLIEDKNIDDPVLLAHSMGGLVARKMLIDEGEDKVKALITLGTPHKGTPLVKKLLDPIEFLKQCPSDKAPIGCAAADIAQLLQAKNVPNTPGLRALKEGSPIVSELKEKQGSLDKIFTLGGKLGSYSAITDLGNILESRTLKYQATYELGYFLMKIIGGQDTDGMVPLKSALPDWSTKIATLKDHDHTEMVRGENYDEISPTSVSNKLTPLLNQIAGDGYFGEPPTINSATTTPNPSKPGETVNFSAEISGDEPIDCEWDFGNGATSTVCNTSYSYPNTGSYDVLLEATNDAGTADTTFTHTVEQAGKAGVIYVDTDATGNNDGSSWSNAFNHLQDGLAKAEAGQEIWVAEGTYYPDEGADQTEGDRTATFQLKNNVSIYGGFLGSESSRNMRDWGTKTTILSGEINDPEDIRDNSIHVTTASGAGNDTIFDGFIVTNGYAYSYQDGSKYGGGMYSIQGSPKIKNVIFKKILLMIVGEQFIMTIATRHSKMSSLKIIRLLMA